MANMYRSYLGSGGGIAPTGNAQPEDVLADKTFSNSSGINKVGTMVNNGAVSGVATLNQPYTIPEGYHNGSGTVTASIGAQTISDATFTGANAATSWTYSSGITGKSNVAITKSRIQAVSQATGALINTPISISINPSDGVITITNDTSGSVFTTSQLAIADLVIW